MEFIEIPWYINVLLTILTSGVLFQIIQGIYFRRQKKLRESSDSFSSAAETIDKLNESIKKSIDTHDELMKALEESHLNNIELTKEKNKLSIEIENLKSENERLMKKVLGLEKRLCLLEKQK